MKIVKLEAIPVRIPYKRVEARRSSPAVACAMSWSR